MQFDINKRTTTAHTPDILSTKTRQTSFAITDRLSIDQPIKLVVKGIIIIIIIIVIIIIIIIVLLYFVPVD